MRKVVLLFPVVLLVLLAGCKFEESTQATLENADTLYALVYDVTKEAKKDGLISLKDSTRVADVLDIYETAYKSAKAAFLSYKKATSANKENAKTKLVHTLTDLADKEKELNAVFIKVMDDVEGVKTWNELKSQ